MSDTSGMSGRHQNGDTSSSTSQQSTSDTSQ
jgi:hypothetical protein